MAHESIARVPPRTTTPSLSRAPAPFSPLALQLLRLGRRRLGLLLPLLAAALAVLAAAGRDRHDLVKPKELQRVDDEHEGVAKVVAERRLLGGGLLGVCVEGEGEGE